MATISSQLVVVFIVLFLQTIAIRFSALICDQSYEDMSVTTPKLIETEGDKTHKECPPPAFPISTFPLQKHSNYSLLGPWPKDHPCGSRVVGKGSPELLEYPKKSILIVESRHTNAWKIAFTVRLLLRTFESDWRVQLVYPVGVRTQLEVWLLPYIRVGRIQFLEGVTELTPEAYNGMLKSKELWKRLWGDWVLIVDVEGGICPKNNPYAIEDFMCYDSIGGHMSLNSDNLHAGNTGFVLRRKALVLEAIEKFQEQAGDRSIPEDSFFEEKLKELKATLPSADVSDRFVAVSSVSQETAPFAWHKTFNYLSAEDGKKFVDELCPEAGPLWNVFIPNDSPYRIESWPDQNPTPDWYRIPE
eukprot:TRINITY_DN12870_c0_g1_i1.p1 TRINITY_DN12870_c0_g1~~TRINITY_DN12870_c0_g1_i1.p1  ORF type:complete len:359 (+),score=79.16 TRINITY_DN12870_c0_g1_i1:403-1479(+)